VQAKANHSIAIGDLRQPARIQCIIDAKFGEGNFGQHAIVQPERLIDVGRDRVEDMRLVVLELDRRRFAGQEARATPYRHRDEERMVRDRHRLRLELTFSDGVAERQFFRSLFLPARGRVRMRAKLPQDLASDFVL
jgi:hypothetical protein